MSETDSLEQYYAPRDFRDRIAYGFDRFVRFFAGAIFSRRYGHPEAVLETLAPEAQLRDANHEIVNELH